jgi:hypothetical protein
VAASAYSQGQLPCLRELGSPSKISLSLVEVSVDQTPSDPSKANSAAMKYQRELAVGTHKATIIQRVWEIQVDFLLKLDQAAKSETSDGSHEVVPIGAFPFQVHRRAPAGSCLVDQYTSDTLMRPFPSRTYDAVRLGAVSKLRLLSPKALARPVCRWAYLC